MSETVGRWKEDVKRVEKMISQEVMSDQMKMTALGLMMTERIEEHFDHLGWKSFPGSERE